MHNSYYAALNNRCPVYSMSLISSLIVSWSLSLQLRQITFGRSQLRAQRWLNHQSVEYFPLDTPPRLLKRTFKNWH